MCLECILYLYGPSLFLDTMRVGASNPTFMTTICGVLILEFWAMVFGGFIFFKVDLT